MRKHPEFEVPEQTPWERLRSLAAIEAIREGKIRVPLSCGYCNSQGVTEISDSLLGDCLQCLSCGRLTSIGTAHILRKQKLRAIIKDGIDVDLPGKDDPA